MGFLTGKKALIVGLLSPKSIAYGIASSLHREGAELAFTYQNEKLKDRVAKMASAWGSDLFFQCDVTQDSEIDNVFSELQNKWDGLDNIIHSVAYAPADQLEGDYLDNLSREGFAIAHDISSYSLGALAKAALPMMEQHRGSIVAMTYLGAERAVPNYNVMGVAKASLEANIRYLASSLGPRGVRVNGISAGPIRTLAASGIKGFKSMLNAHAETAPLRENTSIEQVGDTAAFLCSDMSSGITGEVIYVDGGYHITAMPNT